MARRERAAPATASETHQAELERALGGVAQEGGQPAAQEAGGALLLEDDAEAGADALVLGGIGLHVALDHVERRDGRVREAAAEDAAECTGVVVLGREHHNLPGLGGGRRDDLAGSG
jgi:hypothetical protein